MARQSPTARCLIALGANRGDCAASIDAAFDSLGQSPARLIRASSHHRTAPVGGPDGQQEFINAAAVIETSMEPAEVIRWLLEIEQGMGGVRTQRWGPRQIDLDLILYVDQIVELPGLSLPHPRMAFRRFVLEPAAEAAPEMMHPVFLMTMQELLDHLNQTTHSLVIESSNTDAAREWAGKITNRFPEARLIDAEDSGSTTNERTSSPAEPHSAVYVGRNSWLLAHDVAMRPRLVVHLDENPAKLSVRGQWSGQPTYVLGLDTDPLQSELFAAFEAMR